MTYKSLKSLTIFVLILFVVSCTCAFLGYTKSKKKPEIEDNPNTNETVVDKHIKYRYFLEGVEVSEMPTNKKNEDTNETNETEEEPIYRFDEQKCTNGVTGEFDTEEWKFIPSSDTEAECSLYFNKNKYEVKLTVIKGVPDENNNYFVERFTDGEFKIIPDIGYEYLETQCSNDKVAKFDTSKNILKISAVSSDVACKVTFTQKKLSFELIVKNGKCENYCDAGKIKSEEYYGESLSYIIYPQDRYEFKKGTVINCTNNQVASYESNNFSIQELTSNTKCTLEFTKSTVKKHLIRITNSEDANIKEKFAITQGSDEMDVEEGSTATLTISILEGVDTIPKLSCDSQIPDISPVSNGYTFTWMGVSKNINCRIAEEAKPLE